MPEITVPRTGLSLSDLYDADRRTGDPYAALVAATQPIPHPLTGVAYADGERLDTTAGHVACTGCAIGRPCSMRRDYRRPWWQDDVSESLNRLSAHVDGVEA